MSGAGKRPINGTSEARNPYCCLWWDLACEDLTGDELTRCREDGLFCSPDECEFCKPYPGDGKGVK